MTQEPPFTPEAMVEWAMDMAAESATKITQEERLALLRVVVQAFVEAGVIHDPGPKREQSFELAANALYICSLVPMVFPAAYKEVETGPEAQRLSRIEHLKRSFDL